MLVHHLRRRPVLALAGTAIALSALVVGVTLVADDENQRLVVELDLRPGMRVADVGAGSGELVRALSRVVGEEGRVFATEVSQARLAELRDIARSASGDNIQVIEAGEDESGLPPTCCEVLIMRRVYHHLTNPAGYLASLARSLTPRGRLAVVDFEPRNWGRPEGVPSSRRGHGMPRALLLEELRAAGFVVERNESRWDGRDYLLIARRP